MTSIGCFMKTGRLLGASLVLVVAASAAEARGGRGGGHGPGGIGGGHSAVGIGGPGLGGSGGIGAGGRTGGTMNAGPTSGSGIAGAPSGIGGRGVAAIGRDLARAEVVSGGGRGPGYSGIPTRGVHGPDTSGTGNTSAGNSGVVGAPAGIGGRGRDAIANGLNGGKPTSGGHHGGPAPGWPNDNPGHWRPVSELIAAKAPECTYEYRRRGGRPVRVKVCLAD